MCPNKKMASSHKLRAKAASKTLQRHFAALAQVISPLKVAQELFSAEVNINSSTMGSVRNLGVTREDKAHDVLWAVFSALETNPSAFDTLCNVLFSEAASEDIARKLKGKLEDRKGVVFAPAHSLDFHKVRNDLQVLIQLKFACAELAMHCTCHHQKPCLKTLLRG